MLQVDSPDKLKLLVGRRLRRYHLKNPNVPLPVEMICLRYDPKQKSMIFLVMLDPNKPEHEGATSVLTIYPDAKVIPTEKGFVVDNTMRYEFVPRLLVECGSCGNWHWDEFHDDCRGDTQRHPDDLIEAGFQEGVDLEILDLETQMREDDTDQIKATIDGLWLETDDEDRYMWAIPNEDLVGWSTEISGPDHVEFKIGPEKGQNILSFLNTMCHERGQNPNNWNLPESFWNERGLIVVHRPLRRYSVEESYYHA